jgi:hypothetical protein
MAKPNSSTSEQDVRYTVTSHTCPWVRKACGAIGKSSEIVIRLKGTQLSFVKMEDEEMLEQFYCLISPNSDEKSGKVPYLGLTRNELYKTISESLEEDKKMNRFFNTQILFQKMLDHIDRLLEMGCNLGEFKKT